MFVSLLCFLCFIPSLVGTLLWFCFLVCVLVSFVLIGWYHFWFPLLTRSVTYTFFSLDCVGFVCVCVCVCVCLFHCFYYLSDFAFIICLGLSFVSCFVFVLIPFNAITNDFWSLGSHVKDQAWDFGVYF